MLYKEQILELYNEKPNFGELKSKTHTIKHVNPACNDEITIDLEIKDNKIIDARFRGISCFISTISSSALLENIKGMTIEQVQKLSKKDVDKFIGMEIIQTRAGCELFALEAIKKLNLDEK